MKKRMYNAPKISVLEIVASSMIATSIKDNTVTGPTGTINTGTITEKDAGSARTATRQYFDIWSDDEEW